MSYSVARSRTVDEAVSLNLEIQAVPDDANADLRKHNPPTSSFFSDVI